MAKTKSRKQLSGHSKPGLAFSGALDISRSRHFALAKKATHFLNEGKLESARKLFMEILNENEDDVYAMHGMALIARDMGRLPVAVELMKKALALEPRNPMISSNLGTIFEAMLEYDAALASYKNAIKWGLDDGIIHNNIGSVLSKLGRRTEALISFRKALKAGAEFPEAMSNMGTMLGDLGDFKQAAYYFRRALELDPEDSKTHHNFGINLLTQGEWKEGWYHSEWRMFATNKGVPWRKFPQPLWNGNPFKGARLILYAEQGIGDELRYASMIPEAIARGGEIVLECAPRLVSLFQRSFPQTRVVPAKYWPAEDGIEPFDIACPLGTLGRLFRNSNDSFPMHSGYLKPDPELVLMFKDRLKEFGPGPYVGVSWRSGVQGAFRSEYYSMIEEMRPVLKVEGVTYVNLQYDADPEELAVVKSDFGIDLAVWDDVDLKMELDKAAALTSCMDLVLSPNTSVSVMAGALGKETIEFRPFPVPETYFKNGRCPWFPSVRFFTKRQSEKWSKLFRKIAVEIEVLKTASAP